MIGFYSILNNGKAGARFSPDPSYAKTFTLEISMPDEDSKTTTDVSRLSFPLQMVIMIVTLVVTIMATTWTMRSDIRDIATRQELRDSQYKTDALERASAIEELKKEMRMLNSDTTDIRVALAASGILK